MAFFRIIEEEQQAAQRSDSREMATSSMDRRAPLTLLFTLRMCNILARMPEDTFYKVPIQLLEVCFCNTLYI